MSDLITEEHPLVTDAREGLKEQQAELNKLRARLTAANALADALEEYTMMSIDVVLSDELYEAVRKYKEASNG